jgi:hypothetical protein
MVTLFYLTWLVDVDTDQSFFTHKAFHKEGDHYKHEELPSRLTARHPGRFNNSSEFPAPTRDSCALREACEAPLPWALRGIQQSAL